MNLYLSYLFLLFYKNIIKPFIYNNDLFVNLYINENFIKGCKEYNSLSFERTNNFIYKSF